jgi:hypothetical protein
MLGALTPAQIEEVLKKEVVARIGCYANGRPYVVPITYTYDGESVIGHSAHGMKIDMMRRNPNVCVEVDHVDDLANWRSVIAWGKYEELSGEAAFDAIEALVKRLEPLTVSQTSIPTLHHARPHGREPLAEGVVVYRIRLTEKTGRFER